MKNGGGGRHPRQFGHAPLPVGGALKVKPAAGARPSAGWCDGERGGLLSFCCRTKIDAVAGNVAAQELPEMVTGQPGHERGRVAEPGHSYRNVERASAWKSSQPGVVRCGD